jgi:hypothetical protein
MIAKVIDRLGEWNPQLFRELKGKLNTRNIVIATAISFFGQLLIYLFHRAQLPNSDLNYASNSTYCANRTNNYECLRDSFGNWIINWDRWWLDVFIFTSIIGILVLLVVGTYMLIADLANEERHGTLDFIRLSPQSFRSILIGKILGVPILLYWVSFLAIPLHLGAGKAAHLPLSLILGFYLVLVFSCIFFYSFALLYGFISSGLGSFQAWLGSGFLLISLFLMMGITWHHSSPHYTPADWLKFFYPGTMLAYLVDASPLAIDKINYLYPEALTKITWYDLPLWSNVWFGIGIILANYAFWTYWFWQGLARRFYDRSGTIVSKSNSYWISSSLIVMLLGFVLQRSQAYDIFNNFGILSCFYVAIFLILIAALSPHRQTLQDWARYRHQMKTGVERKSLWHDLVWGEKSPSTVAIAINLAMTTIVLLSGILLLPLAEYKIRLILGLFLQASIILIYAAIAQIILLMKGNKRGIWASSTVSAMVILPMVVFSLLQMAPDRVPNVWLFSALPLLGTERAMVNVILLSGLAQWLAIAFTGLRLGQKLNYCGRSATQALLSRKDE